jgi:hypothetical protein
VNKTQLMHSLRLSPAKFNKLLQNAGIENKELYTESEVETLKRLSIASQSIKERSQQKQSSAIALNTPHTVVAQSKIDLLDERIEQGVEALKQEAKEVIESIPERLDNAMMEGILEGMESIKSYQPVEFAFPKLEPRQKRKSKHLPLAKKYFQPIETASFKSLPSAPLQDG